LRGARAVVAAAVDLHGEHPAGRVAQADESSEFARSLATRGL
jgi:hypothetical protein